MNKYNLVLLLLFGIAYVSCNQDAKINNSNCLGDLISDSIYNNVVNSRYFSYNNDTIISDKLLSEYNNLANFGLYKVKMHDSNHFYDLFLYIKYAYLDTNTQKSLMMSNKVRDSRKICFYLYNDILSYSDDYVRNKKINLIDVKQIIENYYLDDSVHLIYDVYNRNKGIEIKYHNSASKDEFENILTEIGISYISVINKFCNKQFGKKIYEITNEQLSALKDSLYFFSNITISYSLTGSFDVYN